MNGRNGVGGKERTRHRGDTRSLDSKSRGSSGPPKTGGERSEERWDINRTILLVEDDRSVRDMLALVLRRLGYQVLSADDGPRAIDLWDRSGVKIDLLMTDLGMSRGMNGLELAQRLREEKNDLKVIVFSGFITEAVERKVRATEDTIALQKPFDQGTLARVVSEFLAAGRT
jgi:CheY-like chemotaxis protein